MAELALAIIPLGITVTSGLTKYLKAFNDHDDDRARLVRQAERFESTFQSLDAALKRSELDPGLSSSASEAHASLKECHKALKELEALQQKVFVTTTSVASTAPHARKKDKIKGGCKKLMYPLQKPDIEVLEGALNRLSTTLNLALGILHLDGESLTRKTLNEQMVEIQKNTVITSVTSTAINELRQPISKIDLALPVLQTSVDSVIPHFDHRFDQISYQIAYQNSQMQAQIKSLLDTAELTGYLDRPGTSQQRLQDRFEGQGNCLSTNETDWEFTALANRDHLVSMCSCPSRRMRQDKWFGQGSIHFADEMLSYHCHEKDCVFFFMPSGYEKTRTIRFTGFASLFKRGLEVSFTTRARAGKFSISPSFTYFPVVDEKVAPGFLVMSLLSRASSLENMNETKSRIILSAVQRKLQELFCSGRASPNDVTQENYTLLHLLIDSLGFWLKTLQGANSPFVRLTFEGLLNFLIAAGTSVTVRSRFGEKATHKFVLGSFVPASLYRHLNAENEAEASTYSYYPFLHDRRGLLEYHDLNQSVARSLAIIQNNLREVERIISLYPNMLGELSYYKETPLHIAIDRPDILRVLAKKAKPEDWIRRSLDDATSLNLAIQASREICHSGDVLDESCCPCTLPLRIILSAGCPIIPYRDFRCSMFSPSPKESFFESSTHCKILLTKELRNRRRQLRDLAKSKLSITEFSRFATLEEVPDVEAIGMDSLLRQKDILGQGPLSSFVDGDLPPHPQQDVRYCSRSIFFDLKSPEDADLFVDSGFNMLCANRDHDSSLDRMLFAKISPDRRFISLDYAIWLFEHQAPLWKWSYRFTNPMPSAFVLADILGIQDYKCSGQENSGDKAEHYLGESILVDDCTCLCSPRGCTPFASRMKWLAHSHDEPQDHTPQDIATKFGYYVETYGDRLDLKHHLIMVRQATFAALELKHTCLDRPAYSNCPGHPHWIYMLDPVTELGPDEVEFETLNVDVEAKNQLESVVTKFQDFVLTGDQMTVSSKVKSFDVDHSVSNNQSVVGVADLYCQRALEFWKHIWENRIQDALEAVAKGWDNRLNGENDVVQISTCEEAMQEAANGFGEENDEVIFNGIIQQIQDI